MPLPEKPFFYRPSGRSRPRRLFASPAAVGRLLGGGVTAGFVAPGTGGALAAAAGAAAVLCLAVTAVGAVLAPAIALSKDPRRHRDCREALADLLHAFGFRGGRGGGEP